LEFEKYEASTMLRINHPISTNISNNRSVEIFAEFKDQNLDTLLKLGRAYKYLPVAHTFLYEYRAIRIFLWL